MPSADPQLDKVQGLKTTLPSIHALFGRWPRIGATLTSWCTPWPTAPRWDERTGLAAALRSA